MAKPKIIKTMSYNSPKFSGAKNLRKIPKESPTMGAQSSGGVR